MKVYISGPVTGIPGGNREAFFARERELLNQDRGFKNLFEVANPVKVAICLEYQMMRENRVPSWEEYMRACIRELCTADEITFLPGWENSKGARLEKQIAEALGIKEL